MMMNADAESRLPSPRRRDLWSLPDIESLSIERVRYSQPRRHAAGGKLVAYEEGVEITVHTSSQIPIRALSAALFVGDVQIAENEQLDTRTYRFFVLDEPVIEGASVSLGWVGQPPPNRAQTTFRYERPTTTTTR